MASRDIRQPKHALRFLDVYEEPTLNIFSPIPEYENTPLVSIDKAIVPLEPIVPYITNMVQTVKMDSSEPEEGLTRDESNSIRLYSLEWQPREYSLFSLLNKALRSTYPQQLKPWLLYLRLILTALSRLPSTRLVVYRGINMDLTKQYPVGATIGWHGFSSCLKMTTQLEKRLFLNRTGKRTIFIINSHSSKQIHQHSTYESEGEVLLLPARQFTVASCVNRGKGLHIIELNEIQPAFEFSHTLVTCSNVLAQGAMQNVEFRPISTVSLSKKSFRSGLSNPDLEETLAQTCNRRFDIDLNGINLNDSDMDSIITECTIQRQCHQLDLSHNDFTFVGISILGEILGKNKTLTTLDLGSNRIGDKGVEYLGEALKLNSTLTTLYIGSNLIGEKGAEYLGEALKSNTTLTTLHLEFNKVGDKGAEYLCEALKSNTTLTILDLGDNQIGQKGTEYLGEALKSNSTLTTLYFWYNECGDEGAEYLGEPLKSNSTLTTLNLQSNQIGDKGAEYLGEALKSNSTLTTLDLGSNRIGEKGAEYLGEALKLNSTLTILDLGSNRIGEKGAEYLGEALKLNSTLITLNLQFNTVGQKGAEYLGDALKSNSILTTLDLQFNKIGDKGAEYLRKALKSNTTLTTLHLEWYMVNDSTTAR